MSSPPNAVLWKRVRQARRRLLAQALLSNLLSAWLVALTVALAAAWALPWLANPPAWAATALPAGLFALGTAWGVWRTFRRPASRQDAALEIDRRFHLNERVTTAVTLDADLSAQPAGQALVTDAGKRVESLTLAERFPVRANWRALVLPVLLGGIVAASYFGPTPELPAAPPAVADATKDEPKKPAARTDAKSPTKPAVDRLAKSEALKKLDADVKAMLEQAKAAEKPEQAREKVAALDKIARDVAKERREQMAKFDTLQKQMQQLERRGKDEATANGPAQEMRESISRGDVEKAKKDVDKLRKKVKDKDLSEQDKKDLARQMDELRGDLERLARQDELQNKLKELIQKAKAEGKDAESLDRELQELKKMLAENPEMQKLAEQFKQAAKAMKQGDLDKAAEQMEQLAKELGKMDEQLKDLEELDEHLQRLKEERKKLCKKCQGNCDSGEPGEGLGKGRGKGDRPDNPDAASSSVDERREADFDPRGKRRFAGSVSGPAFKGRSTAEMAGEIREAVQEAPEAVEVQRLPRAAREMVREYFERLGDQGKK